MPAAGVSLALEQGRLLFNAGRYFQAHEAWEEAWLAESGDRRVLLQGLIQIAAGLHKAKSAESRSGCARLLDAGLEKLGAAPTLEGLAVSGFRAGVVAFRQRAEPWLRGEPGAAPPPAFPVLERGA